MASKEATKETVKADAPKEPKAPKEKKEEGPTYAFEFKLLAAKIGAATTNKQVKAKVSEAFMGYGAFDECRVTGDAGADRVVVVFFARLFGKGQPAWDALTAGTKPTISIYDETVEISQSTAKPSGGGATTGTAFRPKKEGEKKKAGRGDKKDGKDGEGKDGDKKDGGRGRGRGKKEEVKGPSLQRGRANIGGKLGPVSKVRLAKQAKEAKEKEAADRLARGEKVEVVEEKKEEDPSAHIVKPKEKAGKKEDGKKEGGKKEAGKAEGGKKEGGKKEAGKAEAGKKDAGKKEAAPKADAGKKEAAKKGK